MGLYDDSNVFEQAEADIIGAKMVLENKLLNGERCLLDPAWQPKRQHVEGILHSVKEALDELVGAQTKIQHGSMILEEMDALIAAIEFEVLPILDGVDVDKRCHILLACAAKARNTINKTKEEASTQPD